MSWTKLSLPSSFNEDGEVNEPFETVHLVKRDDLKTHHTGQCSHQKVTQIEALEMPGYLDVHCHDCGRGFFIPKPKLYKA